MYAKKNGFKIIDEGNTVSIQKGKNKVLFDNIIPK